MLYFLTEGAADGAGSGGASLLSMLPMLLIMVGVFYFMLIRPENKRKKEAENMRASVKNGDKITTIGGIVGTVVNVNDDKFVIETGDVIDARINRRLIENLFFKNSPLHDGALVIANNRIVAVRCTLPITEAKNLPANYGMRHKAAIGMTEESDADVVVVSEETGKISFVKGGQVTPIQNINELKLLLTEAMGNE